MTLEVATLVESGSDRRLIGATAAAGLPPCCESWIAEQLLEEAKRGRGEPPRPDAEGRPAPAGVERGQPGPADARPDIRLV